MWTKHRKRGLIVSGLEPMAGKSDTTLFISLCHDELDIDPVVVKTTKLGSISPAVHKVQPLLVFLREADKSGDS
jgi:hypothetical protein